MNKKIIIPLIITILAIIGAWLYLAEKFEQKVQEILYEIDQFEYLEIDSEKVVIDKYRFKVTTDEVIILGKYYEEVIKADGFKFTYDLIGRKIKGRSIGETLTLLKESQIEEIEKSYLDIDLQANLLDKEEDLQTTISLDIINIKMPLVNIPGKINITYQGPLKSKFDSFIDASFSISLNDVKIEGIIPDTEFKIPDIKLSLESIIDKKISDKINFKLTADSKNIDIESIVSNSKTYFEYDDSIIKLLTELEKIFNLKGKFYYSLVYEVGMSKSKLKEIELTSQFIENFHDDPNFILKITEDLKFAKSNNNTTLDLKFKDKDVVLSIDYIHSSSEDTKTINKLSDSTANFIIYSLIIIAEQMNNPEAIEAVNTMKAADLSKVIKRYLSISEMKTFITTTIDSTKERAEDFKLEIITGNESLKLDSQFTTEIIKGNLEISDPDKLITFIVDAAKDLLEAVKPLYLYENTTHGHRAIEMFTATIKNIENNGFEALKSLHKGEDKNHIKPLIMDFKLNLINNNIVINNKPIEEIMSDEQLMLFIKNLMIIKGR